MFFSLVLANGLSHRTMYNLPAVTGGIDMDSDLVIDIAKSAPNICGIKLTCGSVGKLTRITTAVNTPSFQEQYPRKLISAPLLVIDGFIDFLLPSMSAGSSGAITGLANFAPVRGREQTLGEIELTKSDCRMLVLNCGSFAKHRQEARYSKKRKICKT